MHLLKSAMVDLPQVSLRISGMHRTLLYYRVPSCGYMYAADENGLVVLKCCSSIPQKGQTQLADTSMHPS